MDQRDLNQHDMNNTSAAGSSLTRQERLFLSWMHPRGVVSAAVAAIFALRDAQRPELEVAA